MENDISIINDTYLEENGREVSHTHTEAHMHLGGKQVPKMSSMQTFLGIQMKWFMQNKTNQKKKKQTRRRREIKCHKFQWRMNASSATRKAYLIQGHSRQEIAKPFSLVFPIFSGFIVGSLDFDTTTNKAMKFELWRFIHFTHDWKLVEETN